MPTEQPDFDSNYWQQIKPGMNRFDDSGAGTQISSTDYSIWAQVGRSRWRCGRLSLGQSGCQEKPVPNDGNFTYETWTGSANQGDYAQSGTKDLRGKSCNHRMTRVRLAMKATGIVADASTMSSANGIGTSKQETVYGYEFLVSITQFPIRIKTPVIGRCLKKTVITSSQPLGTIKMTVSLASSNFGAFSGLLPAWVIFHRRRRGGGSN